MTTPRIRTGRVFIGSSLDGFISRPDGNIDWLTDPAPGPRHANISSTQEVAGWESFFPSANHLVMGRGTYEKVLTFDGWPYPDKRVLVMSTTLTTDDTRVTVTRDLDEAVQELASSEAGQVYVDGGSGLPLFGDLDDDVQLELVASNASGGMVNSTYRVHRPRPSNQTKQPSTVNN
ncbi:dihydrofolate reductase family protein [Flexivirga meconopsidis]|uniref:dihydrofolate reductase family protein n=1 Tax=Flexivirga meconopsidis TaxID=2977121 RepID=UPI00223FBB13|nr:dihydrofolate reductase [Flexivirga meconopsidis]